MRSVLIHSMVGALVCLAACGDDEVPAPEPADVSGFCDLDRPREECLLDEAQIVNSRADIEALCSSPCRSVRQISMASEGALYTEILSGYHTIGALRIVSPTGPTSLPGLEDVRSIEQLRLSLPNLENLNSLSNLEVAVQDPDTVDNLEKTGIIIEGGRNMRSLEGLSALREIELLQLDGVGIDDFSGLKSLEKMDNLVMWRGANLKSFEGLENIEELVGLAIIDNPNLSSLEGWSGLRHVELGVTARRNPKITDCEFETLVDSLTQRPELVWIEYNAPCSR